MKKVSVLAGLGMVALLAGGVAIWQGGSDPAVAQSAAGDAPGLGEEPDEEALRIRSQIQNDPIAPTIAPQGHDVTLVVFADYQCPFCRKLHPALETLIEGDPKVRVVFRDWPVFGAGSEEAARAAIASNWQDKHAAFNDALMTMPGRVTSESIRAAADQAGVDWTKLQADLAAHEDEVEGALRRNGQYAAMLGLQGTPGMLVGPYLIPGAIDLAGLRKAVSLARADPEGTSVQ
jgi:protein-disulfide isomerase